MSDLVTLLEIFGGTGAVLLGIAGCMFRCYKKYDYGFVDGFWDKNIAPQTLQNNWEYPGDEFPENENFGNSWKRNIFAKNCEKDGKDVIKVDIDKKHGSVYIYTETTMKPEPQNNGKHYLRVKFSHVPKKSQLQFQSKPYKGDLNCWEKADFHKKYEENIKPKSWCCCFKNTVYLFEPRCKIGLDDVTKEQLGVWINSTEEDIKDLYIEEAYLGRKQNIKNIFCCGKQIYTFLWSEKHKED